MVTNKRNRELAKLPVLFIVLLLLNILPAKVTSQTLLFPSLFKERWVVHRDHQTPADSATQQVVAGFDAAPIYYEWSDSTLFHRDYQTEGFIRYQAINRPWNLGIEYRYRTLGFVVHPVEYQDLKSQLTTASTRIFLSRKSVFGLTPAAMLSYDQASRRWNYYLSLQWSWYRWFRPKISHQRSTIAHSTVFHLFQTRLDFQDHYKIQTTSMAITSSESAPIGYDITYSPGEILQPTGIKLQNESQQTDLLAEHWDGSLWCTLYGEVMVKPHYVFNRYHGKSFWYSSGTRFADFNKIQLTDKLLSIELHWRNFTYSYALENLRYALYGQVRGFPFTKAAIDLLGSEFVISSQGASDIAGHQFSFRIGGQTAPSLRFTTAYQQVDLPKFDYRTYALILGFPRQETLRISRSNLQSATLLKIAVHARIPITPHLTWNPALLQYVPIQTKYISTPQQGEKHARSGNRHTFGGLRISMRFTYTI